MKIQELGNSIVIKDEEGNVEVKPKTLKYVFNFLSTTNGEKTYSSNKYNTEIKIRYNLEKDEFKINIGGIGFFNIHNRKIFEDNLRKTIQDNNPNYLIETTVRPRLVNILGEHLINDEVHKNEDGWLINEFLKLKWDSNIVWNNPIREEVAYEHTITNLNNIEPITVKINNKDVKLFQKEVEFLITAKNITEISKEDILQTDESYWSTIKNCIEEIRNGRLNNYNYTDK